LADELVGDVADESDSLDAPSLLQLDKTNPSTIAADVVTISSRED
jgi:hypothetical protein